MIKHFCVSVYVFDSTKQTFLFIKHKKLGKWLQPGGHIDVNEDPITAALREVFEETGLHVTLVGGQKLDETDFLPPITIEQNWISEDHLHMDFVYGAIVKNNQSLVLNEIETDGIEWFNYHTIMSDTFNTFDNVKTVCSYIANHYFNQS